MEQLTDIYEIYSLVKALSVPFDKTPAYKHGIIDAQGNVLKKHSELSAKDKKHWTHGDMLINWVKKSLLQVANRPRKEFFHYAAALFLAHSPQEVLKKLLKMTPKKVSETILGPDSNGYMMEASILAEDMVAPTMSAGSGNIAGIGVGPQGEPGVHVPDTFAGCKVFGVDSTTFQKCRFGKKKYAKYENYVGTGPVGEAIKNYGRSNRKKGIILMDNTTGSMFYLKRPV